MVPEFALPIVVVLFFVFFYYPHGKCSKEQAEESGGKYIRWKVDEKIEPREGNRYSEGDGDIAEFTIRSGEDIRSEDRGYRVPRGEGEILWHFNQHVDMLYPSGTRSCYERF